MDIQFVEEVERITRIMKETSNPETMTACIALLEQGCAIARLRQISVTTERLRAAAQSR